MHSATDRYSRHAMLRVIGKKRQAQIEKSKVLVVGLGALGSLIAMLLARAGVGHLRIVDGDMPELHNLHRQILYEERDVASNMGKAESASVHLKEANSSIRIESFNEFVNAGNVNRLVEGMDIVVDALDNITTRYLVNDTAIRLGVPFVFGGAVETAGNVMSIIPGLTPCLRCLWPDPGAVENHPKASTVGVLSAAATAVASIEVAECLKVLVGRDEDLIPGLLILELWGNHYQVVPLQRDPNCLCQSVSAKVRKK